MRTSAISLWQCRYPTDCGSSLRLCVFTVLALSLACIEQGSAQHSPQSQSKHAAGPPVKAVASPVSLSYDQTIQRAKSLVATRPQEALLLSLQAIRQNPGRYEAHVIAAAALGHQEQYRQSLAHLQTALGLAPRDETSRIARAIAETRIAVSPDTRRQLDVLRSILDDADKAHTVDERYRFLREFLDRSEVFATNHPDYAQMWLLRGAAALEVDNNFGMNGREAAFQVMRLGEDSARDEKTHQLIVAMDRKGWVYDMGLDVQPQVTAFNNLMRTIGTVEGTGSDQDAFGFHSSSEHFTYGELNGNCSTGFDLDAQIMGEDRFDTTSAWASDTSSYLQSGSFHFEISKSKFGSFAYPGPGMNRSERYLSYVYSEPYTVRNKRKHLVITKSGESKTYDSEPSDLDFSLVTRQLSDASSFAELLNKLHWACLLQLNSIGAAYAAE